MTYAEKLRELLPKIEALGNTFMAGNIRKVIEEEERKARKE